MSVLLDDMGHLLAGAVAALDYATDRELDPDLTPILLGASAPSPDAQVVLNTYPGGPAPDSRNGWSYPRLQVRVLAATALDALQLEQQTYDALQAAPGKYPTQLRVGSTWLLQDCYALQSEAEPLGQGDSGRHEYVRNYQLAAEPA